MIVFEKCDRKYACNIVAQRHPGFDRQAESDMACKGGFRPAEYAGQHRYGVNELVALDYQMLKRAEGWPVKLAGEAATRLYNAMVQYPEADRLALVTLDNAKRFAMPAEAIDLSTGYSSGAAVREALVIDARNLRHRIAGMIESAGLAPGDGDAA